MFRQHLHSNAGGPLTRDWRQAARALVDHIVRAGDARCLGWLEARKDTSRDAARQFTAAKARLTEHERGLLSIDDGGAGGGLSEARQPALAVET